MTTKEAKSKCLKCQEPCAEIYCLECQHGYEVRKALRDLDRSFTATVLAPLVVGPNGDFMTSDAIRKAAEAFMATVGPRSPKQ